MIKLQPRNESGYILMLTLAVITLCMFLSAYVYNRGLIFTKFSGTMIDREKSRQLAYGGIELAKGLLAVKVEKAKEEAGKPNQAQSAQSDNAQLLKTILPILNKPQQWNLKQAVEGVNGTLVIMLASEEGKININKSFDFEKHTFMGEGQQTGDMKVFFQELFGLINKKMNVDLFAPFEKFLKERKYPLNDVTQLLTISEFQVFKNQVFFDPVAALQDTQKEKIYLTDLFTIFSIKKEIDPWLLSESVKNVYGLKTQKVNLEEILKNFKEQANWKNDWAKSLGLLYGIEYTALPKSFAALLSPLFAPKVFSAFSYAQVKNMPIALWAILEREKTGQELQMAIRKLYVL